ncbi:hypothetical protein NKH18_22355 [Streptomyces sp. M10(2022)]
MLHLTAGTSAITDEIGALLAATGLDVTDRAQRPVGIVVDATGITAVTGPAGLSTLHAALHPVVRSLAPGGRVIVLGTPPSPEDHHQAAAQQALEGFVRSLGKEIGKGATVQLLRIAPAPRPVRTPPSASCSPRSAYISGQVIELTATAPDPVTDWAAPSPAAPPWSPAPPAASAHRSPPYWPATAPR